MEDTTPTPTYNYSNEYGLGFAKCQPFLYIEDVIKKKQIEYGKRNCR